MTPEQLAQVRQWAEWGETPTSETTIALLDHVDTLTGEVKRVEAQRRDCFEHADKWVTEADQLTARLEAVRELHEPIRVYTECYHDNCTAEHIEVLDYPACENSFEGYACQTCCYGGTDYMQEWCPHDLDHDGLDADHACPTRAATFDP